MKGIKNMKFLVEITEDSTGYSVGTVIVENVKNELEAAEAFEALLENGAVDLGTYQPWDVSFDVLSKDVSPFDLRLYQRYNTRDYRELLFA